MNLRECNVAIEVVECEKAWVEGVHEVAWGKGEEAVG